jgi:nucleoside-diphosphate-sugar epimerase
LLSIEEAGLTPEARAFYAENRRVSNIKAQRLLGWRPLYRDYRAGLRACLRVVRTTQDESAWPSHLPFI